MREQQAGFHRRLQAGDGLAISRGDTKFIEPHGSSAGGKLDTLQIHT